MYRWACAANECIEVGDLYKVARKYKETWILFLESTFSLVLCTFHQFNWHVIENTEFSWNICMCFSSHFHDHAFKLKINWPSAIILSTFIWKYERKYDFWLYFPMLSIAFAYAYKFVTSRSCQQHRAPRNNCLENYQTWHMSSPVVRDNYLCAAFVWCTSL